MRILANIVTWILRHDNHYNMNSLWINSQLYWCCSVRVTLLSRGNNMLNRNQPENDSLLMHFKKLRLLLKPQTPLKKPTPSLKCHTVVAVSEEVSLQREQIRRRSVTHPLCSSSSLMPLDATILLKPRWLRLIDRVKLWLYSGEKKRLRMKSVLRR